jgi:hypothetical protein
MLIDNCPTAACLIWWRDASMVGTAGCQPMQQVTLHWDVPCVMC